MFAQAVEVASEVAHVAAQFVEDFIEDLPLALVGVLSGLRDRGELGALLIVGDKLLQHLCRDDAFLAEHGDLLGDVFQLPHIARPLVVEHDLLGLIIEGDFGETVDFLAGADFFV